MSSGLLDFFTLEASEYVEHLDGLVATARGGPPDLEACLRHARALRGSATMAKMGGIAEVAGALERVAQGLQIGSLRWNDALRGAFVAAIDDLKILIRAVRTWGAAETSRAAARTQELAAFAPTTAGAATTAPYASGFLATETAEIARTLLAFAENPTAPGAFAAPLQRVRALRGIALLKDLPPLPEIVDALDQAAKSFELGGAVTPALRALFSTAAVVLADSSMALTRGERPATSSDALTAFAEAASALGGGSAIADDIVPISALFPDDGAPGLVSAAPTPPTSAAQRFRLEVVSHAEHLRRLVGDAAQAVDAATRERLARELGGAARALARLSTSFGETPLAAFFEEQRAQASLLAGAALSALDQACQLLSAPHGKTTDEIVRLLRASGRETPASVAAPTPVVAPPMVDVATLAPDAAQPLVDIASLAPDAEPAPVDIASLAPDGEASLVSRPASDGGSSGDTLAAMLNSGLAGLSGLEETPLAEPATVSNDVVVPIEDLVYRGRDALDRAIELRDQLKQAPGAPDPAMLAELFDLLELAATSD
ncbi:MAG: Hpt domain-containing protein [Gemmatimonadetes bacterium]|nr:Hpt domain-containing protein [Gemmatimonadota bacterium]